jgi:hypothetical protein
VTVSGIENFITKQERNTRMEIINVLNRTEFERFKAGHMIQTVGTNPLIACDTGRRKTLSQTPGVPIDVTPRGNHPKLGHFACTICSKVCTTKQALGGHVASHKRKRKLLTHAGTKHS